MLAASVEAVASSIGARQYRYASERELQEAISHVLTQDGFLVRREYDLGASGRVDLAVTTHDGSRIGVEVKVDGATQAVIRQLTGYADSGQLAALMLVTTRLRHVPDTTLARFAVPFRIVVATEPF